MNLKNLTVSILSGVTLASASFATAIPPARADFFSDIQNTINSVNGAVSGARDVHGATTNALTNLGGLGSLLGIGPSAPSTDIFDIYGSWYGAMSPSEKEVVKVLVSDYAEDKQMSFSEFKKSPEYGSLSAQAKSTASAIFFKFKEVSASAAPVKDKFLAFAFCLGGGSTKCK
jgi:hypothetical protein